MREKLLTIELVESFDEIKSYLDKKLVNDMCDDNGAGGSIDLACNNKWVKLTSDGNIYALFMIRPINSITAEIHPMIKSEYAMYAEACGWHILDWLKKGGNKQAVCVFPLMENGANVKLAERCGFAQTGKITDSWLKNGKLYDLAIYQRSL